jgi:outer membrane protein OmpA-like peptidoglycan-associated protein
MAIHIKSLSILCLLMLFTLLTLKGFSNHEFAKDSVSIINGNEEVTVLKKGYYLVIGVFPEISEAQEFIEKINKKGFKASIGKLSSREHYYVYLNSSEDLESIKSQASIEKEKGLSDFWILNVDNQGKVKILSDSSNQATYYEENPEEDIDEITITETNQASEKKRNNYEHKSTPEKKEYHLYFQILNATNYTEVDGMVEIWRGEASKKIGKLQGNEVVSIERPGYEIKSFQFVCDVVGFRRIDHQINLDNPVTDSTFTFVEKQGDTIIIYFELPRLQKGDVEALYDVYFYNDATIMKGQSKYALEKLVEMMEDDDNLRIRIHGHTNGNRYGKIITLEEGSTEYFHLSHKNRKGFGSARRLSNLRAETIREYLIFRGVDPERMETRGWGARKNMFDPYHIDARKNARVEIEIIN